MRCQTAAVSFVCFIYTRRSARVAAALAWLPNRGAGLAPRRSRCASRLHSPWLHASKPSVPSRNFHLLAWRPRHLRGLQTIGTWLPHPASPDSPSPITSLPPTDSHLPESRLPAARSIRSSTAAGLRKTTFDQGKHGSRRLEILPLITRSPYCAHPHAIAPRSARPSRATSSTYAVPYFSPPAAASLAHHRTLSAIGPPCRSPAASSPPSSSTCPARHVLAWLTSAG